MSWNRLFIARIDVTMAYNAISSAIAGESLHNENRNMSPDK